MNNEFKYIFLITVDCLRADHVGCIGKVDLTPNIDKLARDSVVFTRAFANDLELINLFPRSRHQPISLFMAGYI